MPDLIVDVSTTTGTGSCTAVRTADWSGTTRIVQAVDLTILKLFDDSRRTTISKHCTSLRYTISAVQGAVVSCRPDESGRFLDGIRRLRSSNSTADAQDKDEVA